MDTQKRVLAGVVLLVALLILFFLMKSMYTEKITSGYTYAPAGFSFAYHPQFKVDEKRHEGGFVTVTLLPITPPSPLSPSVASEADPVIACTLFKNREGIALSSWIATPEYTTFTGRVIEDTTYPSVDIVGKEALGFKTDGLYVSDHVAFENIGHFIDCSVGYITLDDPLRINFVTFIASLKLSSQ